MEMPVELWSDADLDLEEQMCAQAIPHLQAMIDANTKTLEAVRTEKALRGARKAVAA